MAAALMEEVAVEGLQCQLLHPLAKVPIKAHPSDAGFDLFAVLPYARPNDDQSKLPPYILRPGQRIGMGTGVAVSCPRDVCFQIWPRSGLASMGLDVLGGVVDASYRGEVMVLLINHGAQDIPIYHGGRIAQLLPVKLFPCASLTLPLVTQFAPTERGTDGFGSSGTH